jgi:hypothetical protein
MKNIAVFMICFIILSGCITSRTTMQEREWPIIAGNNVGFRSYIYAPVEEGAIQTFPSDTLKGLTNLLYYPRAPFLNIPYKVGITQVFPTGTIKGLV